MIDEIVMDTSYLIGVEEIDVQHKHLCLMVNILIKKANGLCREIDIQDLFLELKNYVRWHFPCEESLMVILNYKKYDKHKEEHIDLLNMLSGKIEDINSIKTSIHEIPDFLYNWFGGHSFGYDKELGQFVNQIWKH